VAPEAHLARHRFADLFLDPPTMRNNDPRLPFHQLLEGGIVYVRDLVHPASLTSEQIVRLALMAPPHAQLARPRGALHPNSAGAREVALANHRLLLRVGAVAG
jgi:hypothetical protein